MQVENIECQIAKAQIGNYLAGAGLSEEALTQLEEHLGACAECKKTLDARRSELLSLLAEEPTPTADTLEEPTGTATSIAAALRKKSLQAMTKRAVTAATPAPRAEEPVAQAAVEVPEGSDDIKKTFWKPLMYSLALGAVLVAMSMFSKNASSVLGTKLSDTLPPAAPTTAQPTILKSTPPVAVSKSEPTAATSEAPKATAAAATSPPTVKKALPVATAAPASAAPKQPAHQTAPRPQAAPTATVNRAAPTATPKAVRRWTPRRNRRTWRTPVHRPATKAPHNGIRVYDASGKPL